ncbi:hypothetical protein ACFX14_013436 [Malus domestica]
MGHATNDYIIWMKYLVKLVKEGKCDQYVNRPAVWPKGEANANGEPPTKTIRINIIFTKSKHLGATNSSKNRKIQ